MPDPQTHSDDSKLKILAWRSHFADKEMTDEVDEATKELDGKKRMAIYASLQRQMWERGPFVFLLQADEIAVMPKSVTGFLLGPTRSTAVHFARLRERSSRVSDAGEGASRPRQVPADEPSGIAPGAPTTPASGQGGRFSSTPKVLAATK